MGWAVGTDREHQRHIGYGVPAVCDQPDCGKIIDRGMAYACGGGKFGGWEGNCGLFFCSDHLMYAYGDDEDETDLADDRSVCDKCAENALREFKDMGWIPAYEPTDDTPEWAYHVINDESWAQFRAEESVWTARYQKIVDDNPNYIYTPDDEFYG